MPAGENKNTINPQASKPQISKPQEPKETASKGIQEGLSSLKAKGPAHEGIESKMPSRMPKQEDNAHAKIEIPTSSKLHEEPSTSGKKEAIPTSGIPKKIPVLRPQEKEDTSIFGGKTEVSRMELEHKMRGQEAWKAERRAGLTLSPLERSRLVKDIPQVYGRNISKSDLSGTVRKLNRDLLNAKKPEDHARLRKEIKFFKELQK